MSIFSSFRRICSFRRGLPYTSLWSRRISIKSTAQPGADIDKFIRKVPVKDVDGLERSINVLDISTNINAESDCPPIVILPGTAQTINTFQPHFGLSKSARLIIPELRCQGKVTDLLSNKAEIAQHVADIELLLETMSIKKVRLAGFSFGGRVAIAFAAHKPHLVDSLSLTCVPLTRPALGGAILSSWEEALANGNMREAAWSFVFNGYSQRFLTKYATRLPTFVDIITQSNDAQKLHDLLRYSHVSNNNDPMSVALCACRLSCPVQVIAATNDRIAGIDAAKGLFDAIKVSNPKSSEVVFYEMDTGHVACFEDPVRWRNSISNFFGFS